jgi:DNA-binding response OmpR family regulator
MDDTSTILVVEDDVAVAELEREVLNDRPGWGATVVHDAAAARAVFRHVEIDVLVLDFNLPGISGLELLGLLRDDPTGTSRRSCSCPRIRTRRRSGWRSVRDW